MKKNLFLIAITSIGLMACGGKQQSAENQEAATDTLTVEESVVEETVSPDYVMLNLKSKVKSYEIKGEANHWDVIGFKVSFDENGTIAKVEGDKAKLERNDKGQIIKYSFLEQWDPELFDRGYLEYSYDENGQLVKISTTTPLDSWDIILEKDENGDIAKWIIKSVVEGTITSKYAYQEYDEKGNWTKRTIDGQSSSRKITYWE